MSEEDGATDIGNMHKIGKDRACGSGERQTDTQKRRQTDILITIFHNRSGGRSKAPFTRYNLLSNRLPIDNRLNVCIHDTTGCQTGLTTGCIVYIQTFNRLYRVNRV